MSANTIEAMSATTMNRPPSPPHSNDGDYGLHTVRQHLAGIEKHAQPRSIRPAPMPSHEMDLYGDPSYYQMAPSHGYYTEQPTFVRTAFPHTPPTVGYEAGMRTRTKRAAGSPVPEEPRVTRTSQSPRPKRPPRQAKAKAMVKATIIDKPLSELTKDYNTPVKDMEVWVTRSAEVRQREVDRKKGYIARPMNSFMLYRSAYAERVKQYCKENNHQVVSQVSGASWPLEPKEIRQMYESFATTERDNHQAAFPHYKFAPNKNGVKKRKDIRDDSDDDDPEWDGSSRSGKRARSSRGDSRRSQSATPLGGGRVIQHPLQHLQKPWPNVNPSSYYSTNPNGPPPVAMVPEGYGGYYEQNVTYHGNQVEDVSYRPIEDPFPQQLMELNTGLTGLPNCGQDILGQPIQSIQSGADSLDPALFDHGGRVPYRKFDPFDPLGSRNPPRPAYGYEQHRPHSVQEPVYGYLHQQEYHHPGMQTLTDIPDFWTQDFLPGSNFDDELSKL